MMKGGTGIDRLLGSLGVASLLSGAPPKPRRRVVLVIPPDPLLASCNRDAMGGMGVLVEKRTRPVYPPMDVVYAATVLGALGAAAHVVDSLGRELSSERVTELEPDMVAVRVAFPTLVTDLEWAARFKRVAPGLPVVAFGPVAAHVRDEVLACPAVDAVAVGEPEVSLVPMAFHPDWIRAPGVVTRGKGARTPPLVKDLDALPVPDWSLIPIDQYTLAEIVVGEEAAFPVLASRGCPHGCRYCPYPIAQGRHIRSRSVGTVLDEMEHLVERWGVRHILFRDPCFGMDRAWVERLCRGVLDRRVPVTWRCETRAELLTHGLLDIMAAAGLASVNLGVESVDPAVLRRAGRRPRVSEAAEVIRRCRALGVEACVFLMAGLPGDTTEGFRRTVQWAAELQPAAVQVLPLTFYPGTAFHRWAVRAGSAQWTHESPRLRGRSLVPTWWGSEQARALEEARGEAALAHARWLQRAEADSQSSATGSPVDNRSVVLSGERLRSYVQAARILVRRGDSPGALHWLNAAAEIDPSHVSVLVEQGKMFAVTGDKEAAEGKFRRALQVAPGSLRAALHLAMILAARECWDDALPLLEDLLDRDDLLPARRAGVHHLLATAYAHRGQRERASRHRQKWLEMMADQGHEWQIET